MKKSYPLITTILYLLLWLPAAGQAGEDLAAGQRSLRNNDVPSARQFLEKAYRATPEDTAAIAWLAEACIRGNDAKRAEQVLERALKTYPELPILHLKLGIAQNLRGRYKKAQESFAKANTLLPEDHPERSTLYVNLGLSIMNDERPVDALPWFELSLELNPRNVTAQSCKGTSLYLIGDYEEAIKAYTVAIDIDSKNPITYFNRGMAYMRKGDNANGCQDFHTACRMGNMNACKAIMVQCTKQR